ncbi:endogenous retrovirus group K member 24 Gag polyprotein-like [Dipodomys merriami]|uniref:endogenous retrovirus group K member 24 Gag polyprotein-like n=1 Tax=Dipodomys merriami TaxID=94247 RepID=UPI003855EEE2
MGNFISQKEDLGSGEEKEWAKFDQEHTDQTEAHTVEVKTRVKITPPDLGAPGGPRPPPYGPKKGEGSVPYAALHRDLPDLDPYRPSTEGPRAGEVTYAEAYPVKEGSPRSPNPRPQDSLPQAYPVNLAPGANRPLEWYTWEAKDLKELRKAVADDGPNSPWAQTLLQDIAYHPCVPKDWRDAAKAVLTSSQFIKWCAFFEEECRVRAENNQQAQPTISITYAMLAGTGEGYSTGVEQAAITGPYRDQVRQAGLAAWYKLDEWPTESPIAGVRQKPGEPLPDFIDRVQQSINRKLPAGDLRDQFVKLLVSQSLALALQAQTSAMAEAITQALAAQGQGTSRPLGRGTCFKCGQEGHFKRDCPQQSPRQPAWGVQTAPYTLPQVQEGVPLEKGLSIPISFRWEAFKLGEGHPPAPLTQGGTPSAVRPRQPRGRATQVHWTFPLVDGLRPKMSIFIDGKRFHCLIDARADRTILREEEVPLDWKLSPGPPILGVGDNSQSKETAALMTWTSPYREQGKIRPHH